MRTMILAALLVALPAQALAGGLLADTWRETAQKPPSYYIQEGATKAQLQAVAEAYRREADRNRNSGGSEMMIGAGLMILSVAATIIWASDEEPNSTLQEVAPVLGVSMGAWCAIAGVSDWRAADKHLAYREVVLGFTAKLP